MTWEPNEPSPGGDIDDGTIVDNVAALAEIVIGHRITGVNREGKTLVLTLDNGINVELHDGGDCCAYTEVDRFVMNADNIDHIITGVRTEGGYTVWSIFADMGDVLQLHVDWSCGNPFYYGYGFNIIVDDRRGEAYAAGLLTEDEASRFLVEKATEQVR